MQSENNQNAFDAIVCVPVLQYMYTLDCFLSFYAVYVCSYFSSYTRHQCQITLQTILKITRL